jgi:hypothetical protein
MEGYFSTGQSPQRAVVPVEEEEMCVLVYSCQILMKLDFSRHVFEKPSNSKFYKNPASGRRVVPCDGQRDGHRGGQT